MIQDRSDEWLGAGDIFIDLFGVGGSGYPAHSNSRRHRIRRNGGHSLVRITQSRDPAATVPE
ncbi:MAG: hypothetical protein BGO89_04150 [Candidatus Kapaibacterium thiocyanatum]|uniref:Uncharacterized protein n=1 Tax=Candidatus Kapaibacterium thiocyanatum TaxID=1895771 RepID=A0A1M3L5D4_9BACT|nr:MAG: hypothetical protein BGO89_04150 ['Candidatus Kapabacteria' thiocyanatum]